MEERLNDIEALNCCECKEAKEEYIRKEMRTVMALLVNMKTNNLIYV